MTDEAKCVLFSDPPSAPQSLRVSDTQPTSVTLKWQAPQSDGGSPVTHYLIEKHTSEESEFTEVYRVDGLTQTYKVKGLTKGKDYLFRVKAENPAGLSSEGAELDKPTTAKLPFGRSFESYLNYGSHTCDMVFNICFA